jgi:P-type conjugative transfer protein TrbJ
MKLRLTGSFLALAAGLASSLPANEATASGWPVFDASNFAQNILEAARALEQINNQIKSLQNEAVMLQNDAKNLASLDQSSLAGMTGDLQRISGLMTQAQGITFDVQATQTMFDRSFPAKESQGSTIPTIVSEATQRWQLAMDAFRQSMTLQSAITETVQSDTAKLGSLVDASQGAVGNLQVSQTTNQLLALSIKQQLQIENLMAADARATNLEQARKAQSEESGKAALTRFLGDGNAYTPE